jgi:hypothetical protein
VADVEEDRRVEGMGIEAMAMGDRITDRPFALSHCVTRIIRFL